MTIDVTKPFLFVPDWDEMQHYKNRTPPWIKLQNDLLENYEFECLPDASKAHLLCIWLLASRTNNKINPDLKWIQRKICANTKVDIAGLVASGFLQLNQPLPSAGQDASKVQAECLPRGRERVEEEESRGRGEREGNPGDEPPTENQEPKDQKTLPDKSDVMAVFDYWLKVMERGPRTQASKERVNNIKARLKDGYTVEEIKLGIDGCTKSAHHMGDNDRATKYNDIELICRTGTKLESFIGMNEDVKTEAAQKNDRDMQEWLNEKTPAGDQGNVFARALGHQQSEGAS